MKRAKKNCGDVLFSLRINVHACGIAFEMPFSLSLSLSFALFLLILLSGTLKCEKFRNAKKIKETNVSENTYKAQLSLSLSLLLSLSLSIRKPKIDFRFYLSVKIFRSPKQACGSRLLLEV